MRYAAFFGMRFLQRGLATFQMLRSHVWLAAIVLDITGLAPGSHCAGSRLERLELGLIPRVIECYPVFSLKIPLERCLYWLVL